MTIVRLSSKGSSPSVAAPPAPGLPAAVAVGGLPVGLGEVGVGNRPQRRHELVGVLGDTHRHLTAGLRKEVDRTLFESLEGHLRAILGVGTQHEHRCRLLIHDALDGLDTVHPRHLQIHRHRVRLLFGDDLKRLNAVFGLTNNRYPSFIEEIGDQPAHKPGVVDDDRSWFTHRCHPRAAGGGQPARRSSPSTHVGSVRPTLL
jgi:hypothetical protein